MPSDKTSPSAAPSGLSAAASGPKIPRRVFGNDGSEDLTGTAGIDWIYGRGGEDFLIGLGGNDKLYGGEQNDWLFGGAGNDVLYGEFGDDELMGGPGNDALFGGHGNNKLNGGTGADRLVGSWNDDRLLGAEGGDTLSGHTGNDTLAGGAGKDVLTTGEGYDDVVFDAALNRSTNVDRVTDFNPYADRISLDEAVFGRAGPKGHLGAGAFAVGSAAQDSSDRIIYDKAGGGYLYYDPDGQGGQQQIVFAKVGVIELSHAAFWVI